MHELCIQRRAALTPDRVALFAEGRSSTFAELAAEVASLPLGDEPLVVLSEPSSRALYVRLLALLDAGRPFALLHPRLTERERDTQARLLQRHVHALPNDVAAVLFTSGSSGAAKAACLSRSAFVASARATAQHLGPSPLARWLLVLPLCHVGGLSVLTRALVLGTTVVLERRFEPARALMLARQPGITGASLVPTMIRRLLRETDGPLDALGTVVAGGAAMPSSLLGAAGARGLHVVCTYGLTEACSQVTLERLGDPRRSSGVPVGAVRVEVVAADGTPLPRGAVGALRVDGPSLFSGYLGEPPREAPFDTGDLGWLDPDGRLHVESRRTDLIVTGGENVYPLEVERTLLESGLLEDVVVFGAPDPEWGQAVRAAGVAAAAAPADLLDALEAYAREHLAPHKRPKRFELVPALPTLPSGKVDRRAVARAGTGPGPS